MTRGILLDIEGTTTPIRFVYDVLFPFARKHAHQHLGDNEQRALKHEYDADVANGLTPPPWSSGAIHYVHWLMDQDRKSTALKTLQGNIWQEGYRLGDLRGEVFADVPDALGRWHNAGVDIRIYSSGSILAQKLLFSTTPHGDLTRFLKGHFDTTTGPKTNPSSYTGIAATFGMPPSEILFISDVVRELDAASTAGLQVLLSVRPGNPPQPPHHYESVTEFGAVGISGLQSVVMAIEALEHIQLAMPAGQENLARSFYSDLLQIPEIPKPPQLSKRGGVWFESGPVKIHLGIDPDFRPAKKAHPGLLVRDLNALVLRLRAAGIDIVDAEPLPGFDHVYVADPFGNRIELMERQ